MGVYSRNECLECKENPVAGQRMCQGCRNAYMRAWRKVHALTPEQRMKMNARSYAHVYLKRGKLVKGVCEVCVESVIWRIMCHR